MSERPGPPRHQPRAERRLAGHRPCPAELDLRPPGGLSPVTLPSTSVASPFTSSTIPSTPCSAPRFKAPAPEAEQPAEPSFERVTRRRYTMDLTARARAAAAPLLC